MFPLLLIKDS